MIEFFKRLYTKSAEEFYQKIEKSLKENKREFIITANPETFTIGENNSNYHKMLLDKKSTLIPDGIGIVYSARMLKFEVTERITVVDLASKLLDICNDNSYKLAILGAKEEVLESFKEVLKKSYPHIKLVKCENGYTDKKDEFFEDLKSLKPDVCLVALGIPNQEELIYKHLEKFDKGVFVGVGGSLDVLSGTKKRAPKIFQKLNLEWLYRIVKEPKRLKRFYENNIKFVLKIRKIKH